MGPPPYPVSADSHILSSVKAAPLAIFFRVALGHSSLGGPKIGSHRARQQPRLLGPPLPPSDSTEPRIPIALLRPLVPNLPVPPISRPCYNTGTAARYLGLCFRPVGCPRPVRGAAITSGAQGTGRDVAGSTKDSRVRPVLSHDDPCVLWCVSQRGTANSPVASPGGPIVPIPYCSSGI